MKGSNRMMVYVEEYFTRKMLAKLGYRFDPNDLTNADVDAFNVISSVIAKNEKDQIKKMRGKRNGR